MAKTSTFTFAVSVRVPAETARKEAKRLLKRVIQAGMEDATSAPDDFDDPDARTIRQTKVGTPADQEPAGFAVVQEADGQVVGAVHTRRTIEEAIDLALAVATEQTDTDSLKLRAELETEHRASDRNGDWAVYVTGVEQR